MPHKRPSIELRRYAKPRKREELPFPDLPASHEKNKLQVALSVRIDREIKQKWLAWVKEHGYTNRQAVEYALKLAMERNAPTPR